MKRRSSERVPGTALTLFVDCFVTVVAGVSWETAATLPLLFEWKSANVPLLSQLTSPYGMVSNLKVPKTRSRQVESVTTSFDNTDSKSMSSRIPRKVVRSARVENNILKLFDALEPHCVV